MLTRMVSGGDLEQRTEGQLHGGGVAAWICHQACRSDLVPVQLCKAVHSLLLQLWGLVLASVPVQR